MKTLEIASRRVSIDTDKLSKGLCDLHASNDEMKAVLAFGMLDAKLCEMFEEQLSSSIRKQFSEIANDLFKTRIESFIKECVNDIEKGVYRYADFMVV
jgi:hypothetical protein